MGFKLTSAAFVANGKIPGKYTCDGANLSPLLSWSGAPGGTRSFALVCADPDAPAGTWYHWAVYDIPPHVEALPENRTPGQGGTIREAINDFGRPGYGGPCPPHGHGTHHYHFTLYALNVEHLGLSGMARCRDVEHAARAGTIGQASLIGLYAR